MENIQQTGTEGEQIAVNYLLKKGFAILNRNWRQGHCEVDIIASKMSKIHFIEVKTRYSLYLGYPEKAVTKKKMLNLIKSAEQYLYKYPVWQKVEFDIISIILRKGCEPEIFFVEDVYL